MIDISRLRVTIIIYFRLPTFSLPWRHVCLLPLRAVVITDGLPALSHFQRHFIVLFSLLIYKQRVCDGAPSPCLISSIFFGARFKFLSPTPIFITCIVLATHAVRENGCEISHTIIRETKKIQMIVKKREEFFMCHQRFSNTTLFVYWNRDILGAGNEK